MSERFAVLGFARPRTQWFSEVGRWATSGSLPIDFVKCVSAAEVRARMDATTGLSAILLDGAGHGVDRDLIASGRDRSVAVIVVDRDATSTRDWLSLGAAAVLDTDFDAAQLTATLRATAAPIRAEASVARLQPVAAASAFAAPLIAVTGVRGAGASTIAIATAQGLAGRPDGTGSVLLADFALDAIHSTYHDSPDVAPAVQELVEAHRGGDPDRQTVRSFTFEVDRRGYSLLLGLRRQRDWTALPSRAVDAMIESLRSTFRWVVADCTPEFDGDDETGSVDLEERNHLARRCVATASAVVVVGSPQLRGIRQLVRLIDELGDAGVDPQRILPVINAAPRSPAARAHLSSTVASLVSTAPQMSCVHLPMRRSVESAHRDVNPLPAALVAPLTAAVSHVVDHGGPRAAEVDPSLELDVLEAS